MYLTALTLLCQPFIYRYLVSTGHLNNPDFLPPYYSGEEVEKDAKLKGQLSSIARKLRVLADKIEDTASIAGMEALSGVLAYYNTVKQAARNNINGAQTIHDDLGARFSGRQKDTGKQ